MSSHITNIAIVGSGGQVGGYITDALLKTGKHTVTAITREGSSSKIPEGVKVAKVNYDDVSSIAKGLEGQDALIITMGIGAPKDTQMKLIDAAGQAGVKYVMPNEYGVDHSGQKELGKDTFIGPGIMAVREYCEKVGKSAWVALCCSFWYEFSLAGSESRYGFDFPNKSMTFFDDGNTKINTSTWPQTGRAVASLFSLPESELAGYKNKGVYVSSFHVSQRDMFESVLRVTNDKESDWKISHEPTKDRYKRGLDMMQQGGDKQMVGFGTCLYTRVFYPTGEGSFEHKLDNEKLGLPKEDYDEATKVAVKMAEEGFSPYA